MVPSILYTIRDFSWTTQFSLWMLQGFRLRDFQHRSDLMYKPFAFENCTASSGTMVVIRCLNVAQTMDKLWLCRLSHLVRAWRYAATTLRLYLTVHRTVISRLRCHGCVRCSAPVIFWWWHASACYHGNAWQTDALQRFSGNNDLNIRPSAYPELQCVNRLPLVVTQWCNICVLLQIWSEFNTPYMLTVASHAMWKTL